MAIILSQKLKQQQKLTLTPSLKKSIDLLQLSRFELINKIQQEIEDNPFLEKTEDFESNSSLDKDFSFEIESKIDLKGGLLNQINDLNLDDKSYQISKHLIENIDEAGKLMEQLEDLEELSNFKYSIKEMEEVLEKVIHKLHPLGVGHRDHKECIKIQIQYGNLKNELKEICLKIILNDSLDDLNKIKKDFINKGGRETSFENALNEIKKCDLSPGLNFQESQYVYPDLKIIKENNQTKVRFIEKDFPKIKIDENLAENVKKNLKIIKNNELSEKITEARWLLSSINRRNDTVLRVGELILSRQINFFENNPIKIETLSNKEISEKLNIHPSTVSRILRNKYIESPMGIIPLKSLMVSSVSKSRNVTSIQLMKLIEDITKKEKKPKSDKQITIELNKRGFNLARRTITKYRKMNNIPSSRDR
tara:strand:- start:1648 stop:2913 length:1266 start_codon:yes stop_codon:yes gene_type:complete